VTVGASFAAGTAQSIFGLPGWEQSCPRHTFAIRSAAPGTSRATRRIAEISWVTVSRMATASARIVDSTAWCRRPLISETLAEIYRLEVQRYFPTRHLRG
jgi:hypothetical protein